MIWMGVIKPNDLQPLLAPLALCPHKLVRIDVVASFWRIFMDVGAADRRAHGSRLAFESSKQDSTTLAGIGFLPVTTHGLVID
jgi:hypothetical protein